MLTNRELIKIYQILGAYNEGLIVNPSEEWEIYHYDQPIADKKGLTKILIKIERLLPESEFKKIDKNILQRKYDTFNNEINEAVYRTIEKAFNNLRIVEIGYFDMDSAKVIQRKIEVYYKTRKYVIGYCHLRNAMRKFRTSRIVSARLTEQNYKIPDDFDKNEFL
jgi:predicted DNA-binding transcriptional regulator YafY